MRSAPPTKSPACPTAPCRTARPATGVGVSLTLPLYQGGAARRARPPGAGAARPAARAGDRRRAARRRQHPRRLRHTIGAANEAIESNEIAVAANELALEGTRAEQTVGTRNILDVLNAEQELLNSQVLLVTARRDAYVAGFQLLNAMGKAEAEDLNLDGGPLYDPTVNYERYVGSWSDWNDGPPAAPGGRPAPPRPMRTARSRRSSTIP